MQAKEPVGEVVIKEQGEHLTPAERPPHLQPTSPPSPHSSTGHTATACNMIKSRARCKSAASDCCINLQLVAFYFCMKAITCSVNSQAMPAAAVGRGMMGEGGG